MTSPKQRFNYNPLNDEVFDYSKYSSPRPKREEVKKMEVDVPEVSPECLMGDGKKCNCMNEAKALVCRNCLHLMKGRIMNKTCEVHPRQCHLMDIYCCPKCLNHDSLQVVGEMVTEVLP